MRPTSSSVARRSSRRSVRRGQVIASSGFDTRPFCKIADPNRVLLAGRERGPAWWRPGNLDPCLQKLM
jgi:hypothetical protein